MFPRKCNNNSGYVSVSGLLYRIRAVIYWDLSFLGSKSWKIYIIRFRLRYYFSFFIVFRCFLTIFHSQPHSPGRMSWWKCLGYSAPVFSGKNRVDQWSSDIICQHFSCRFSISDRSYRNIYIRGLWIFFLFGQNIEKWILSDLVEAVQNRHFLGGVILFFPSNLAASLFFFINPHACVVYICS